MSAELLTALIAAGTPPELVAQVAQLAAEVTSLRKRRAADAARQREFRSSRYVTNSNVMSRDVTPRIDTTPPKKKDSKRNLSIAMPPDWELSSEGEQYALDRGWTLDRVRSEAERFKNHALAGGRKQRDWGAAWRNWVTSPYQKPQEAAKNGANRKDQWAAAIDKLAAAAYPEPRASSEARVSEGGDTVVPMLPRYGSS